MHAPAIERSPQQRVVSLTLVVAIHVAAIMGLLLAFKPTWLPVPQRPPVNIDFFKTKTPPPTTHPIDVTKTFLHPTAPPVPVPPTLWEHSRDTITPPPANPGPATGDQGARIVLTPPSAIAATHSTPDYPPLAVRLSEEGSVRLSLAIDERGYVTDASVVRSSGYDVLDTAAIAWVKAHWRYQPATRDHQPVSSTTDAVVTFRLINRRG